MTLLWLLKADCENPEKAKKKLQQQKPDGSHCFPRNSSTCRRKAKQKKRRQQNSSSHLAFACFMILNSVCLPSAKEQSPCGRSTVRVVETCWKLL